MWGRMPSSDRRLDHEVELVEAAITIIGVRPSRWDSSAVST